MNPQSDNYQGNLQYAVDLVMCIDATASMGPVLDSVKEGALTFQRRLAEAMGAKSKSISQLRVRVVAFRDFGHRTGDALETTGFLTLPEQSATLRSFLDGIKADGGGDIPESGLEALAVALGSDWETGLDRRRHVIVVFTDAPAHPLGGPHSKITGYPAEIPRSMDELTEQWGYQGSQQTLMEQSAKRLVLFAPAEEPWSSLRGTWSWDMLLHFPSQAGEGLEEFELDQIIDTIAQTL